MDLRQLEGKIKDSVRRLRKINCHLEIFEPETIQYGLLLGRGGEGVVHQCIVEYKGLPLQCAVKSVLCNTEEFIQLALEELEILCMARDPIADHVLQVYGVSAVPTKEDASLGHLAIITEAGLKNSLQFFQEENHCLKLKIRLLCDLASAIHYVHQRKIMHRDIKPENVLITHVSYRGRTPDKIQFKIMDFGMGRQVRRESVDIEGVVGTKGYHPPEMWEESGYDITGDIYMLGVTFAILLLPQRYLVTSTLRHILNNLHESKENGILGRDLFDKLIGPLLDDDIPEQIKNLISQMIENRENRLSSLPDAVEVLQQIYICIEDPDESGDSASISVQGSDSGVGVGEDHVFADGRRSATPGKPKRGKKRQRECTPSPPRLSPILPLETPNSRPSTPRSNSSSTRSSRGRSPHYIRTRSRGSSESSSSTKSASSGRGLGGSGRGLGLGELSITRGPGRGRNGISRRRVKNNINPKVIHRSISTPNAGDKLKRTRSQSMCVNAPPLSQHLSNPALKTSAARKLAVAPSKSIPQAVTDRDSEDSTNSTSTDSDIDDEVTFVRKSYDEKVIIFQQPLSPRVTRSASSSKLESSALARTASNISHDNGSIGRPKSPNVDLIYNSGFKVVKGIYNKLCDGLSKFQPRN
ncbi:unnamed protein product [Owenia fusiformis]|uniref:non-specific serine/threonine protein kinase n=1 Tax=Owenia fusiformis TaxID=6347 RepID=A0A8J1XNH7_OWEFU|nr:unnamed protein product [Owenia fusiformis]